MILENLTKSFPADRKETEGKLMYNFTLQIPTRIHIGKDTISYLSELKEYGDKVLLV